MFLSLWDMKKYQSLTVFFPNLEVICKFKVLPLYSGHSCFLHEQGQRLGYRIQGRLIVEILVYRLIEVKKNI